MASLKVRKIGNSLGALFPAELMARFNLTEGDMMHITETTEGITLSPYNPELELQIETARRVMRQNRNVLRQLAK